jgi:hypothetical protein
MIHRDKEQARALEGELEKVRAKAWEAQVCDASPQLTPEERERVRDVIGGARTDERLVPRPFGAIAPGTKHDVGKVPLHLLPPGPLFEIARVLDHGRREYAEWNWTGGFAASRLFGACLGHLWAWWSGKENDTKSGLPHLAHAACMLLFLMENRKSKPANWKDDRPLGLIEEVER